MLTGLASRTLAIAALIPVVSSPIAGQQLAVLHITVTLADAEQKAVPVARHAFLISDNPASAAPRRVVTSADGTVDVRLRPGNYTVESDEPLLRLGKAIHWTETLDIVAGRDAVLELTDKNAIVETATAEQMAASTTSPSTPASASSGETASPASPWLDSVVGLWTQTAHASGFAIEPHGLIATSQRSIGTATSVEVQITRTVKVAGSVIASDSTRDVAIVRVDPAAVEATRAIPLGCGGQPREPAAGDRIFAIGVPLRGERDTERGIVNRTEPHTIDADLFVEDGSTGGPVFSADGSLVGITSITENGTDRRRRPESRVIRIADACDVVAAAEKKVRDAAPPAATHLPVEPEPTYSDEDLENAAKSRAGSLNPYRMSSADFDIAFITPIMLHRARSSRGRESGRSTSRQSLGPAAIQPLEDFSNWSDYVAGAPPVLLVRVTPKLVEGFWTKVARGAAQTQGVALPPIKRFRAGFSAMRALCGDAEVTPIHPLKIEQRVSETDAIYEGLYVYDLRALGSECATVTLRLSSEKAPEKVDTRVVDAALLQQLWRDLARYGPQQ